MREQYIIQGGLYRHFSGRLYRIECIAYHSESNSDLVIYRSISDGRAYGVSKSVFLSKVDHKKYPAIKQEYKFEYVGGIV